MSVLQRATAAPTHAQLGALLDCADDALVLLDARQRVLWCNPAAVRWLGCQRGRPIGLVYDNLADATHSELQTALAALEATVQQGALAAPWQIEGELLDGRGVRLTLAPGHSGTRVLTARLIDAPPALPRLEARATSEVVRLLWDAPQPLMVQDERFTVLAANRALLQALGLASGQVLGRDAIEFVPPEDHRLVLDARARILAWMPDGASPPPRLECRLRDALGRERWYRFNPRWVSADDGRPLVLSVLTEVSTEHGARLQADPSVWQTGHHCF